MTNSTTLLNNHSSWIELNKSAFSHNVQELYTMRGPARSLGLVVKANAYGHGLPQITSFAEDEVCITHLFVASLAEAYATYQFRSTKRIVVLVGVPGDLVRWALLHAVEFVVYSLDFLRYLLVEAQQVGVPVRVHIKIDTGLGRLGFAPSQLVDLVSLVNKYRKQLIFAGCMTHYAQSAMADPAGMQQQRSSFYTCIEALRMQGITFELYHAAASGGFFYISDVCENFARVGTLWTGCDAPSSGEVCANSGPMVSENFVRIGTSWTGLWKSESHKNTVLARYPACKFRPVMTWFARIMHIANLPKGAAVGYQGTFITQRDSRIAVLPVGYSDGYPRSLSNVGRVALGFSDRLVPVVGIISMNMVSIDVTDYPEVRVGDPVRLLGGDGALSFAASAQLAGTIALDLMTGISPLLPRIVSER